MSGLDSPTGTGTGTIRKREKCASLRQCFKVAVEPVEDFASNTSIHGVKYAFEPRRRFIERCIWVASVAVCTTAAAALVQTSLQKFYNNPTITTIDSFTNDTSYLPFPAVTFCNVNLVFRYKVKKLLKRLKIPKYINMDTERLEQLLPNITVLLRPNFRIEPKTITELALLQEIFDVNNVSIARAVKYLSQSCHDMLERCSWDGKMVECTDCFRRKATFNGYCCSFNYDIVSNWTLHPDLDPYKLRSSKYGPGTGLQVLLNPMKSDYLWGSYVSDGFSIVVHRSGLYPEGSTLFVSSKSETQIRISPQFTDSDPKLKTVDPRRRNCIFYDERQLRNAKRYSREACVLECRAHAVQNLCGCVPFYYVKQGSNNDSDFDSPVDEAEHVDKSIGSSLPDSNEPMSPCSLNHVLCLRHHIREIESENTVDKCQCWPQCTLLSYDLGVSRSNFEAVEHNIGDFYKGANTTGRVSVNVFISSQVAQLTKRDIIYTVEQLMSKLGGIFSLLLGCSLLTAMEVTYYALVRVLLTLSCFCQRSK